MSKIQITMPREYAETLRFILNFAPHADNAFTLHKEQLAHTLILLKDLSGCLGGYPYTSRGTVNIKEIKNEQAQ